VVGGGLRSQFRFVVEHIVEAIFTEVKLLRFEKLSFEGSTVTNKRDTSSMVHIPWFIYPYAIGLVIEKPNFV
jgi:hypothetical protein